MKTVLIPIAAKYMDFEVAYPYDRLVEAGFHVDVYCASPERWKGNDACYGKYGLPTSVNITNLYAQYNIDNGGCPDLLFIPGGVESTEVLRQDRALIECIHNVINREKLLATYCHGIQVLISAGVTKGRKMTCYKGMMVDLKNSGAEVPDESVRVVVDDNLVTAQHYKDNPEFLRTVVEQYRLRNEVIH